METSTPIPSRVGVQTTSRLNASAQWTRETPLRKNRQSVAFALEESNDDIERAERRRSVALRWSILNLPSGTGSPALNESVRVLSEDDIKTHLQICTKLHAENKINIKNAWSLKIIDVLKQLVKKDNPDVLKVAGNSLEIAGKVYGLRVDDLHAEGLKLAGNLARTFDKRPHEDEENEENIDPNAPQDGAPKKKKQKKRRPLLSGDKKHTVNHDPKSWRASLPKLESATFSARTDTSVSAVGNLFTNKVRMDCAGYKFMFLSKEKAWSWSCGNDPSVTGENVKFPLKIKPVNDFRVCPAFEEFHVDVWDPEEEDRGLAYKSQTSQHLEEVVFDDNGIPIPELDGSIHDVFNDRDVEDLNDDPEIEEEIVVPHLRQDVEHIVDFRPSEQVSNQERSDYSYNTLVSTCSGKIDQIWAGPSHWKLKFIRRSQPIYTGQDKEKSQDKTKKKSRKKNEPVALDFRNPKPPIDFSKFNKKPMNRRNHGVDESKITFPLFDPSCKQLIENIEELMTVPGMKPVKKRQTEVEYEVAGYRFDNPNDSNYCPQEADNDYNDNDHGDDIFDNGDQMCGFPGLEMQNADEVGAVPFTGINLVNAPEMVPQSYVNYATKAKRMDMKKLKIAVWITLTKTENFEPDATVFPTTFSQMYKDLPQKLPDKMIQELSCSMAFVALLHLCNEQNLELRKGEDLTDFKILGPAA